MTAPASCSAARDGPAPRGSGAPTRGRTARTPGARAGRRAPQPRTAAPAADVCHRPSSPRRATSVSIDVVAPREAGGEGHGVVPGTSRARRDGGNIERNRQRIGHRSAFHSATWARAAACQVRRNTWRVPRTDQLGAQTLVGQDGCESGGDVVDVEGVHDDGRRRLGGTEVVHARHLARHDRRRAGPHRLEGRQPVPLCQRHVCEGAGTVVKRGQHGVGNRTREDDPAGLGRARGLGPHPSGPTTTSGHGRGREGRTWA